MYCEESTEEREVRDLARRIYEERRRYLLGIARRNAASEPDAEEALQDTIAAFITDFDPYGEAHPLAWLTLALKRRCWRLRDNAHLDRRVAAPRQATYEEPSAVLEDRPADPHPVADRVAERDEARRRLAALKPDERTAIVLHAAGYNYAEIGGRSGWTLTKTNRSLYEGRITLREGVEA
jgi:RNA polymerase sigma factor (sigma-70 family)